MPNTFRFTVPILSTTLGLLLFSFILYLMPVSLPSSVNASVRVEESQDVVAAKIYEDEAVLGVDNVKDVGIVDDSGDGKDLFVNEIIRSPIVVKYGAHIYTFDKYRMDNMMSKSARLSDARREYEFNKGSIFADYEKWLRGLNPESYQTNVNGIDRENIKGYIYYTNSHGVDVDLAMRRVSAEIEYRLENNQVSIREIELKQLYRPGTNGHYLGKGKYIELDHSEQRLYAWEDGKLYKEWSVSGFYDEYAVFGVFDMKNKARKAWSPIAEKWMPYWMAFYYDPKQSAWFGLHELVYWYDEDGNYIEESSSSIGRQKSGGCVRLDRGEMVELYEWSEVGMPFLIHP